MIKVALIGFGAAGKNFHAPFINKVDGLELCCIVSSRQSEIQKLYPKVKVLAEFADIFNEDIDLVVIATPNHLHFEQAKMALERNKHVVVDKPVTSTLVEAKELQKLSKQNNKFLTVFHNRRFDGDFLTIRKLMAENRLGNISFFESNFNRFRPEVNLDRWRETTDYAGGVFFDLAPHLIDQALNLFGKPMRVLADISTLRSGAKQDDYFHLIFDYIDKKIHLNASCLTANPGERFKVHGDKDSYIKTGMDPQENQLKADMQLDHPDFAIDKIEGELTFGGKIPTLKGNYKQFYVDVIKAINENLAPAVSMQDAIAVMELMELCEKSRKQSSWIKL